MGDRNRVLAEAEAEASHHMREAASCDRRANGPGGPQCRGLVGAHLSQAGLMARAAERLAGDAWASLMGGRGGRLA
jgi:hypothetical protein